MIKMQHRLLIPVLGLLFGVWRMKKAKEHIQFLQNKARFLQPALRKKATTQESRTENFVKNEIAGKIFPVFGDDENEDQIV